MRKEVKENKIYLYGEINEIVDEITSMVNFDTKYFPYCDFAMVDEPDEEYLSMSVEEIVDGAEGWYGIHKIDSGFCNSDDIEIICNYWGGGSGSYCELIEDFPESYAVDIHRLIIESLCCFNTLDSKTYLAVEISTDK